MMETGTEVALRSAVSSSLQSYLPENAVFMAERLCAVRCSSANRRLLAESYLRCGKPVQAKSTLEDANDPESRYLYSVACVDLNLLREAEVALRPQNLKDYGSCNDVRVEDFPGGSSGVYLLGKVLHRSGRKEAAVAMYKRALKANPFLWVAYEGLLFFGETSEDLLPENLSDEDALAKLERQRPRSVIPSSEVFNNTKPQPTSSMPTDRADKPPLDEGFMTPTGPLRSLSLPRRVPRTSFPGETGGVSLGSNPSAKLSMDSQSMELDSPIQLAEGASDSCMGLLRHIGRGSAAFADLKCGDAVAILSSLPPEHKNTGLILSLIGRAYMEIGDYHNADETFKHARSVDPTRMDGLVEYYSTVLWHQKKEFELANLARKAVETDRFSAATWCAAGNCFSLQRDPNNALKFFKRAVQVDPWAAYSHTLIGHEYIVKEDLDSAKASYRDALAIDSRHYNAWYGVGHVFQKQENYDMAEQYYREAIRLHPNRATLWYHLGCVLFASGKHREAEKALDRSIELSPSNPVAKFERAKMYASSGEYGTAVEELQTLCETLPREAAVHYELGRIYKKMGETGKALQNFAKSVDLDPKARAYKKALESLDTISDDGDE
ncbi:hypothetical protein NDN08_005508 [Rhodosorus marinus]|uniref:UDP-N-acetylglucosamine--peptide N-acetylglucosaminyltransferase SPINDLY n=1 Tax=Rhodosorus marinus TaxID=101924 RepID=A0AAV8V260_9RHOD|nr:hypothetical protein NDN08_005508 [Rhodosorus marinus]